jgi:hypothetical protein
MSWAVAVLVGVLVLVALIAILVASIPSLRTQRGRRGPRGLPGKSVIGARGVTGYTGPVGSTGTFGPTGTTGPNIAMIPFSLANITIPTGATGTSVFFPLAFQYSPTGTFFPDPPTGPSFSPLNGVCWTAITSTLITDMIVTVSDASLTRTGPSSNIVFDIWTSTALGSWAAQPSSISVPLTNISATSQSMAPEGIALNVGDRAALLVHSTPGIANVGATIGGISVTLRLILT